VSDDKRSQGREFWKRREFLGALGVAGVGGALWAYASKGSKSDEGSGVVYIGGYDSPSGLTVGHVDPDTGALVKTGPVANVPNASFFAYSADRRFLYLTNELDKNGQLTALDITDPKQPKVLNTVPSRGDAPTHLSVHPSGRFLLTANYSDAAVAVHRIEADGRIGESTDLVHQTRAKTGADDKRDAHAHQILTDPSGAWVLCVDLGCDAVFVYRFDSSTGKITQHQKVALPDGTGPRHLAFHPEGKYAYILGELHPVVTVAQWDPARGTFDRGQTIDTIAKGTPGENFPGEIGLTTDGRFAYATNRGENSIAMFSVQDRGARLEFLGTATTGGNWPRHFTLSPDERWMYVSNQRSNTVTWLPRDGQTGRLGVPKGSLEVPKVAIVVFR